MPRISIVTCTYNRADLIGETIQSVLNQTFADFEYLIIDEGEDNTEEVVRRFADSRICYFKVPNTQGHQSRLRNLGMRKSRGEYIAFVDSDDIWLPQKLQEQIVGLEKESDLAFSFTDVLYFDHSGVIRDSLYAKIGSFSGSVFGDFVQNKFVICTTTLLFKRACVETIGFMDENRKHGDFDFIMSLVAHFKAFVIFHPLVRVRKHESNVSRRLPLEKAIGFLDTYQRIIDRRLVTRRQVASALSRLCYSLGIEFARQGDYDDAEAFFGKSIGYDFLFLKPYVRWVLAKFKQSL